MIGVTSEATRAVAVSEALVRSRAAELVAKGGDARVLVMRAQPRWHGGTLTVDGQSVRVIEGISQLAILDAYAAQADDEYLIVLTDRPRTDLGDTVLTRAYRQQIEDPDEWGSIPALFGGAREVSRELRRLEWAATALLDHQPVGGWSPSPDLAVTAEHAIGGLLAHVLEMGAGDLDGVVILSALSGESRASWAAVDQNLQGHLIEWAEQEYGIAAGFALRTAAAPSGLVKPLALGLAIDVLWPHPAGDLTEEQVAARTRLLERYVGGRSITPLQAREIANTSASAVLRLSREGDPEGRLGVVLDQAEALLRENLGWNGGADRSAILRPGFTSRLRALGKALDDSSGAEEALAAVLDHREATLAGQDLAPRMAVRLSRWLASPESELHSLAADLQRQLDDGAWVDSALGVLWSGSSDAEVGAAYGRLIERVRARRNRRDELAAAHLVDSPAEHAIAELLPDGPALGLENVLRAVVGPWKSHGGVLLVVLDGMSGAVAIDLATEVGRSRLVEWVPASKRRLAAVAALPSMTGISRTSLLCGEIRNGNSATEKAGIAMAFPGAKMFHKGELRAAGGSQLAEGVASAIADSSVPVVGVVINAIDDATHKNDTAGRAWAMVDLEPLRALLNAASIAGRAVVLTSDHGHVVERRTEMLPTVAGGDARWRPAASGPPQSGEVLVRGPRVALDAGEAVLLWRDDARYGPASAGYHGGASLAELTVPVLVYQRSLAQAAPDGWEPAPPQAPTWWNDPVVETLPAPTAAPAKKSRKKPAVKEAASPLFEFDEPKPPAAATTDDLVTRVLASRVYTAQMGLAGRAAAGARPLVEAVLRTLIDRNGRAHQDTVASAAGLPYASIGQGLAVVKRLLNVEGYDILSYDSDGETLRLDVDLLRDQFGVA
ncbi:BREX-2 system phosphatase PglZ [Pseudarthrobacter sp. BRE9]|uniref:BREX-2 system phosphatase PglZ n=1 Tax=Pseudarthrobacter sp. BRE9 TaxID=2962582 RepID=UPI002882B0CC|nr:BREX-2 system phosphatase PglZ [Pseudarthrobacter sp. BRE9]MDT0169751.1 BREX-2 system phosphatase PglZ [Pseudarthrobacter sp. BRE9]